jgi:hypothetical protein
MGSRRCGSSRQDPSAKLTERGAVSHEGEIVRARHLRRLRAEPIREEESAMRVRPLAASLFLSLSISAPPVGAQQSAPPAAPASAPAASVVEFDPSGFYAKLGFVWANSLAYDFLLFELLDSTSLFGGQGIAGYRWNHWVATDVEFIYAGGGELVNPSTGLKVTDTSALAGTVNARFYPIGIFQGPKQHDVEWTIDLGLGGGRFFEDTALPLSASTFMARLGTSLDFGLGEHWLLFANGGYYFALSSEAFGFAYLGAGVGYRF